MQYFIEGVKTSVRRASVSLAERPKRTRLKMVQALVPGRMFSFPIPLSLPLTHPDCQ